MQVVQVENTGIDTILVNLRFFLRYLSVLWGMVGSMETMAPDESSRDRLVFLQHKNTQVNVSFSSSNIKTKDTTFFASFRVK